MSVAPRRKRERSSEDASQVGLVLGNPNHPASKRGPGPDGMVQPLWRWSQDRHLGRRKCVLLYFPAQSTALLRSSNGLTASARERERTEERALRVTSGMKFGGYSVAADVGCAMYSLQESKRGSGQDEWTMRDKIPVPGSSSYDMKCQFFFSAPRDAVEENMMASQAEVAHSIDAWRPPSSWHGACPGICACVRRFQKPPKLDRCTETVTIRLRPEVLVLYVAT